MPEARVLESAGTSPTGLQIAERKSQITNLKFEI